MSLPGLQGSSKRSSSPSAPSPGLVPISADSTLCRLSPRIKISPCQSPLTQTLPGTDRATKFLPFLNWTACSCHPKLWPLWRGIRDREQPFILPRNKEPSSSEAFAGPGAAAMLGKALLGCLTPSACPGQQGQLWHLAGGFGVLKMSGCSRSHLRLLQRPRMGSCLHVLL